MEETNEMDSDHHRGHNLDEIRTRALDNILSKLEHGVIGDLDLVQEKQLLISLLEWFNKPDPSREDKVLKLLYRLSKHSPASQILLDIGAVTFLSQLRSNLVPACQALLDQLLENLFRLPDAENTDTIAAKSCVYQKKEIVESVSSQRSTSTDPSETDDEKLWNYDAFKMERKTGYFPRKGAESDKHEELTGSETCFRFSSFPWLTLTPTDRHVMLSVDNSLSSKETNHVLSACDFLRDVVFNDFPPEIFLQRPAIVKSLLSLVSLPEETHAALCSAAAETLHDLCRLLSSRLNFYQDPALYTPKIDIWAEQAQELSLMLPSDRRLISRQQGDGRDETRSSSSSRSNRSYTADLVPDSEFPLEEIDDLQALQFAQLSLPHFCISLLTRSVQKLASTEEAVLCGAVRGLYGGTELLCEALTDQVWNDGSAAAREMADRLSECLENVAQVLHHHHHALYSTPIQGTDIQLHQLAYCSAAIYAVHLIETIVPVELAKSVLPEALQSELSRLLMNEYLASSQPSIRQVLIPYVSRTTPDDYKAFQRTHQVGLSMKATCDFLQDVGDYDPSTVSRLLRLAEASVPSLEFHLSTAFVKQFVRLASEICASEVTSLNVSHCRQILMKLLAHSSSQMQRLAYSRVRSVVKDVLNVENAVVAQQSNFARIHFVLDREVLYEICTFGLMSADKKVSDLAQDIMLHLLQSQLLLPSDMWDTLLTVLASIMPILQGLADDSTAFGQCIMGLVALETDTDSYAEERRKLPKLERLRGTLRLMFSRTSRMRNEGLSRMAWYLSKEEDAMRKRPTFSELSIAKLADIYLVESQRHLVEDANTVTVFSSDEMLKVFDIFHSTTIDAKVKKSAAEQLAMMMRDPTLHRAFVRRGGLDKITEIINSAIVKPTDEQKSSMSFMSMYDNIQYVPACLQMLQYLLHSDSSLRRKLAHVEDMYLPLVRCSLMHQSDRSVTSSAAVCLALLLFDEVTSPEIKPHSIPAFVDQHYAFPIKTHHHHATSPHSLTPSSDSDTTSSDLMTSSVVADRLRVLWGVAWFEGVDALLQTTNRDKSFTEDAGQGEYSPKLKLTSLDLSLLRCTVLPHAVQETLYSITNACTHEAVQQGVQRLALYCAAFCLYRPGAYVTKNLLTEAFNRFLSTIPSSTADESLLSSIISFLARLCTLPGLEPRLITWLENMVEKPSGLIQSLLNRPELNEAVPESSQQSRRKLTRSVHEFVLTSIQTLGNSANHERKCRLSSWRAHLVKTLYGKLNVMDAPEFYNLAALKATVSALTHVTARPGWSEMADDVERWEICNELLVCLLEVTASFHLGRADPCMSFMGRGVTRSAALCLGHLAREMGQLARELGHVNEPAIEEWVVRWLYSSSQQGTTRVQPGMAWLFPLWAYRDPVVRAAGLSIAVSLTGTLTGCVTMATCCQHLPGGVWGLATQILLDQTECSLVRQQAALLLTNLTSQPMPESLAEAIHDKWTGPVVKNEDTRESLVGVPALEVLLHHRAFYQHVLLMLGNYYPHPTIQPSCVAGPCAPSESRSTLSTTVSSSHISAADVTIQESIQRLLTPTGEQATSTPNSQTGSRSQSRTSDRAPSRTSERGARTPPSRCGTPAGRSDPTPTPRVPTPRSTPRSLVSPRVSDSSKSDKPHSSTDDVQSVTSPGLVSALCSLIKNLLVLMPERCSEEMNRNNILNLLLCMIEDDLLLAYCEEMKTKSVGYYVSTFNDIVQLYTSILSLSQLCTMNLTGSARDRSGHSQRVRALLLGDQLRLKKVTRLLKLDMQAYPSALEQVSRLKLTVYSYLTNLLTSGGAVAMKSLTPVLVLEWDAIVDSLSTIIPSKAGLDLRLAAMTFTSVLLREELRQRPDESGQNFPGAANDSMTSSTRVTDMLAMSKTACIITESGTTSASVLCEALISAYDVIVNRPLDQSYQERVTTINALKSLLALSRDAKRSALDAGLTESLVEHLKRCHTKLSADVLQIGKSQSTKRRDELLLGEIVNTFDLIRNFMYQAPDVKICCCRCGLANIVHRLWAWCQIEARLMTAALHALLVFTAGCRQAACSLAYTTSSSIADSAPPIRPQLSPNSLVHCLVKLANRESANNSNSNGPKSLRDPSGGQSKDGLRDHVIVAFEILATLTMAAESRGIIWKSNFLSRFSSVVPGKCKTSAKRSIDPVCWLHMLANLSFSNEGQQMIMKVKDSLELLLEFAGTYVGQCRVYSVLVLRNLAFHQVNKHKLISHGKVIPCLLRSIQCDCEQTQVISASALWSLLHNNQKARVAMRTHNVLPFLTNCLDQMTDDVTMDSRIFTNLEAVIGTLNE